MLQGMSGWCTAFRADGGTDLQKGKGGRIRQSYNNYTVTPNNFMHLTVNAHPTRLEAHQSLDTA